MPNPNCEEHGQSKGVAVAMILTEWINETLSPND